MYPPKLHSKYKQGCIDQAENNRKANAATYGEESEGDNKIGCKSFNSAYERDCSLIFRGSPKYKNCKLKSKTVHTLALVYKQNDKMKWKSSTFRDTIYVTNCFLNMQQFATMQQCSISKATIISIYMI